jgi:hypothetical protein
MKNLNIFIAIIIFQLSFLSISEMSAGEPICNVTTLENPTPGYLRFDWLDYNDFFMVDNYGVSVYRNNPGSGSCYYKLLSNGQWIRFAGLKYFLYNNDMELIDSIPNPTSYILDYHDIELLSNGHFLLICIESVTMDLSQIVEGGLTNASVRAEVLVETDRTGEIYWQWKALEHVNITDVTSDIDLTNPVIDLTHINSVFEDNDGNILISIRHFDEISKIKKSTGDFMWRMGGTKCKNNEFTFYNDGISGFVGFSHQHSISRLSNGNLLLFDNGNLKSPQYSRAVEYSINESGKTATKVWEYRQNPDVYQSAMGSVSRFSNGNTLINWGTNKITEVKSDNTITFEMSISNGYLYRAQRCVSKMDAISNVLSAPGNYTYNDADFVTGVSLSVISLNGAGSTWVQKHDYSPYSGNYSDTSFSSIYPYRWTFNQNGISGISGTIRIKANTIPNLDKPNKVSIYQRNKEGSGIFNELVTSYNPGTNEISANITGFGEFTLGSNVLSQPTLNSPANDAYVLPSGSLTWNKLTGAAKYQIQIDNSSSFAQPVINEVFDKKLSFDYKDLNSNSKYYWRVRGLNSKDTSEWSSPFIFSTVISSPELLYPSNNFVGISLSDSLRWNQVSGAEFYWIQISIDINFNNLVFNNKNIKSLSFPISNLNYNTKYYWRVIAYKSSDSSKWSQIWDFTTTLPSPVLISPLSDTINISINSNLYWSPVVDADYYNIEISETLDFKTIKLKNENFKTTSLDFTDLEYNKQYFWRVKAYRQYDSSAWSAVWNFKTLLSKPELTLPINQSINISVNSNLAWEISESSNSFSLQVSLSEDFKKIIIDTNNLSLNQFTFIELSANTKYYWRVKSFYGKQQSDWSDSWSFTTGKSIKLIDPKLLSPKNNSENFINGNVTWIKVDKAVKYKLQLSLSNDFKNLIVDSNLTNVVIFQYSNLQYEKEYFWRVKAYSVYDSSQWSEIWMFKTSHKDNSVLLLKPGNDELQVPVSGKLEWIAISDINYYQIQVSEKSDFQTFVYDETNITKNYFDYSGLKLNRQYFWKTRFVRNNETSNWSDIWVFTTAAPDSLPIPALKTPSDGKIGALINGALTWAAIPNAQTYQISLSKNRNFNTIFLKNSDIVETMFIYSNLEYNQTYYWRVSAVADNRKSSWTAERSFLTELEMPVILYPENNSTEQPYDSGLLWSVSEDISLYHIQIALDSAFSDIKTEAGNIYEMSFDYNLSGNTTYFCRVKSYNDSNQSRWSKITKFTTKNSTDVKIDKLSSSIQIFPNPATDKINLSVDSLNGDRYAVYSLIGKIEDSGIIEHNVIDITNLCTGFYYLKVRNYIIGFIKVRN